MQYKLLAVCICWIRTLTRSHLVSRSEPLCAAWISHKLPEPFNNIRTDATLLFHDPAETPNVYLPSLSNEQRSNISDLIRRVL